MPTVLRSLVVFAVAVIAPFSGASTIAYQVGAPSSGTQDYTGSLGMDFDVLTPIVVTELGVFDSNQDGLARTLTVEVWDRGGGTPQLTPGGTLVFEPNDPGTLVGGSRFKPLPEPIVLAIGSYTISAHGYGGAERNGNTTGPFNKSTDTGGGAISFVGSSRFGIAGQFPSIIDGGPVNRYAAGTFRFVPVPEPSSLATAALLASAAVGTLRGRRVP